MKVTLFVDFYHSASEPFLPLHLFETFEFDDDRKAINEGIKQLFFAFSKNIDLRKSDSSGKDLSFYIARTMLERFLEVTANTAFPQRYKFHPRQVIFD